MRNRSSVASTGTRALRVVIVGAVAACISASGFAQILGPAFPPPGGATFTTVGTDAGNSGGRTLQFTGFQPGAFTQLYWGPQSGGAVTVAMQNGPQTLSFNGAASSFPAFARWTGSVGWDDPSIPGPALSTLNVRLTLTSATPGANVIAAPAPFFGSGAVVNAAPSTSAVAVNLLFEVETPPTSGNWIPINALPQAPTSLPGVQASFTGAFFWTTGSLTATVTSVTTACGNAQLASTPPVLGGSATITVSGAPPATTASILGSLPPAAASSLNGCAIGIDVPTMLTLGTPVTNASGNATLTLSFPFLPALAGVNARLQAVAVNPSSASGLGVDVTNALQVKLGY